MVVILLGPPGAGKGTHGAWLAESAGARYVATGDLLRAACREGTQPGRRAQGYMDRGELVPDGLIIELVREVLRGLSPDTGVVFDGFPRTVPQADMLASVLQEVDRQVDRVIVLEADDEVLLRRMAGRRSCRDCGAVYNIHFNAPRKAGACDRCGGELARRSDDAPATVRRRLKVYRTDTMPLIQFYLGTSARLEHVAADRPVDEVRDGLKEVTGT